MEITEIKISDDCIACGNCESVCPEVFKVNEKSEVKPFSGEGDWDDIDIIVDSLKSGKKSGNLFS